MGQTIYKKIEYKGQQEVDELLIEAQDKAEKIENQIISKAKKSANIRVAKIRDEANKDIAHKERLLDLEKRQSSLITKQEIITDVFNQVLAKLEQLEGEDLLNYVEKLIKSEDIVKDEILHTNVKDYDKYLKALSTKKKDELVDLDLLNKRLGTNFKISSEPVNIKSGFLLKGEYFDLNFSLDQIVENLRIKNEKAIAKELFD